MCSIYAGWFMNLGFGLWGEPIQMAVSVKIVRAVDILLFVVYLFLLMRISRGLLLRGKNTWRQPPGPAGVFFFGNAHQIPKDKQWLKFDEWILKYGDVVYITVTGQPMVVLGSVRAANSLLDARGSVYSDRPAAVMAGELVGWDRGLGYSSGPPSPRFREFRRLFNEFIGRRSTQESSLMNMQELYATKLLPRLLKEPEGFLTHIRQSTGALLLRVAYGYDINSDEREDPLVNIAEKAMQGFSRASEPGAFLVDTIPWIKYLPPWFPGASFQTVAKQMYEDREQLYNVPYNFVKHQMTQQCDAIPCFVRSYFESRESPTEEDVDIIKAAAASLYSGGIDSTPSSLVSFILAMTLYPEVQGRAQAEIDSVLGRTWQRLPSFSDRERLPYVNAIVLELLRWNPAVPLGLPHRLTRPDEYRGYFLPEGTIVWANIWSMLHDEKTYPQPLEFRPERYLDAQGSLKTLRRFEDPSVVTFGFGRRTCPGMFLALNSVFISVCMMLYVFDISTTVDEHGNRLVPSVEYTGFMSYPRPFQCEINPRSVEAQVLISKIASR